LGIPALDRHVQHGIGTKQVGQRFRRLLVNALTFVKAKGKTLRLPMAWDCSRTLKTYNQTVKSKQFLKLLKAAQAEIIRNRGKGGHYLVKLNGKNTTVPMHGDTDYDPVFLDSICKQLGTRLKDLQK